MRETLVPSGIFPYQVETGTTVLLSGSFETLKEKVEMVKLRGRGEGV